MPEPRIRCDAADAAEHPTGATRGKAARGTAPRSSQGEWTAPSRRADPVALLVEQSRGLLPDLLPIRHGRMMASPFAFFRGSAAVMARDLAGTVDSGIRVQLCGDAHVLELRRPRVPRTVSSSSTSTTSTRPWRGPGSGT